MCWRNGGRQQPSDGPGGTCVEGGKVRGARRHDHFIPVHRGGGRVDAVAPHGRRG
jgi:hypothetical protein